MLYFYRFTNVNTTIHISNQNNLPINLQIYITILSVIIVHLPMYNYKCINLIYKL